MDAPIRIDTGIPLPKSYLRNGSVSPLMIALRSMEVGQSFLVPTYPGGLAATQAKASEYGRRCKPMKFKTRRVVEDGRRAIRIWRVE